MSAYKRKRHVQLELPRPDKNGRLRKRPRRGAGRVGRPPNNGRAGMPHTPRAKVDRRQPQLVTLRVIREIGSLRKPHMYRAIRRALATVANKKRAAFRIVHHSVQGDHLHLLCEADNQSALARGIQGFQISAAKHLNRALSEHRGDRKRRRGKVFVDRYHVRAINSVRQVRNALSYVLNNWRKHEQDERTEGLYGGLIDPFSSGVWFLGWKERTQPITIPPDYEPPLVTEPRTWYLMEGYKRAKSISVYEVPGTRPS